MSEKPKAGQATPELSLPLVGGGEARLGGTGRWQVAIVYRGKHCPLCRKYLGRLEGLTGRFEELGVELLLLSGDPEEKARATAEEWDVGLPLAYGLTLEQMKTLGLYVSEPRSPQETDRPFAEPGLFVTNPDGRLQIVDISNAPFSRPDLEALAGGIAFVKEEDYPVRGTLA